MADIDYTFDPGNNLESIGLSTAQVTAILQAIAEAKPNAYRGMLIVSETQPNVSAGYAWQKRCFWLKASTGAIARYNDTTHAWVSIFSAITNLSGTVIAAGSLPLTALSGTGAIAFNLIRRNAANTAWELVTASDIFAAGTIPTNRLQVTGFPSGTFRVLGAVAPDAYQPYTASQVASELDAGSVNYTTLSLPGPLTTRRLFLGAKTGDTLMTAAYIAPATDIEDGAISGTKLTVNTVPINKLLAGSEGYVVKIVGGVPTWVADSSSAGTFEEDFVFATDDFDFPGTTGTINIDIPITLPASREWKDVELTIAGDLLVTNSGVMTASLKWNTGAETGLLALTSTGGTGQNSYGGTAGVGGTTFTPSLRWKGIVPAAINATNITLRLQFTCTTFLAVQNSLYTVCARATANV